MSTQRALDSPIGVCWRCGHPVLHVGYTPESICPGCRTPMRVCRNCRFFSYCAPNLCSEPAAGAVVDKQRVRSSAFFEAC